MKKLLMFALVLPLLLAGCDSFSGNSNYNGNGSETTGQNGGGTEGSETGGGTTDGGQTESTKVEKDVSEFGFENAEKPETINLNSDITLTCGKGSNSTNKPAYYVSDSSLRFYPGNTLKVSSTKGVITKIKFNFYGTGFSSSAGTLNNDTWTGSASEVTFAEKGDSKNTKLYQISVTYGGTGGGSGTGGGTETGGGSGTTGGGTVTPGSYTSTWPTEYQQYVITYLNGMLPCFLNANKKNLFNGFDTGVEESTGLPYFNPYVKNTSPSINYEYDYGVILNNAGFKKQETYTDKGINYTVYTKSTYYVRYAKYKGTDNIYYFDVYAFNDYYNTTTFNKSYTFQYNDKNLALANSYSSNNKTVTINNWKFTLTDIMKSSGYMQLKNNSGKIVVEGDIKGIYIAISRNSNACFVKAGTSKSNAQYIFNNGYRFDFPNGTKYVEISAQSAVVEFEFFEIGY